MNVSRWPLHKIMMLPDWCFGQRWWIGAYQGGTNGVVHYNMAEENLPDIFVTWGVLISNRAPSATEAHRVTIRLGDKKPADLAATKACDRLMKGISTPGIAYEFYPASNATTWIPGVRTITESKNRKLVIVSNGDQVNSYEMTVGILISSVPKEVPDWVVSGLAGRRS